MIDKIVTPDKTTLSLTIPVDMVGRKVKVIAFALEEETEVIDGLVADLHANELLQPIPQLQKDLVLAEKKRVEDNPELLVDWDILKQQLATRSK